MQHIIGHFGDDFYRPDDQTSSVKALKKTHFFVCEIGHTFVLFPNRELYTGFRSVPKSRVISHTKIRQVLKPAASNSLKLDTVSDTNAAQGV